MFEQYAQYQQFEKNSKCTIWKLKDNQIGIMNNLEIIFLKYFDYDYF